MAKKLSEYQAQLDELGERGTIVYQEEMEKAGLRAKVNFIKDMIGWQFVKTDTKSYRVELVDFIDAHNECEAVDIFMKCIPDMEDEAFDVYEIDPLTKKAVKHE